MSDSERLRTIARACGVSLDDDQLQQMLGFRDFLRSEGIASGGIGPNEADRLIDRHLGDSLAYLLGTNETLGQLLDVGSGVGLPGVPLAIARPDASVVLLDRSQKRSDLVRRAVQMLGLRNVEVRNAQIASIVERWDTVTFRASLPLLDAAQVAKRLLKRSGVAVFGLSRGPEIPEVPDPPNGVDFAVSSELNGVLDSPFWLLRMTIT